MFEGASSLTSLDLSSFDTSQVRTMSSMFAEATSLSELALGENFGFVGDSSWSSANLPTVPQTAEFTGYWQNVGDGTIEQPRGGHVLTSEELMLQYDGAAMADTFVWQRHSDQRDLFTVTVIDAWLRDGRTSGEFTPGDVVFLDPGSEPGVWTGMMTRFSWESTPAVDFDRDTFIMPESDVEVRAIRTRSRIISIYGGEFADPSELTRLDEGWWGEFAWTGFADLGNTVTINADAPEEGYRFVRWENIATECEETIGCIQVEFENRTSPTTTFVVPTSSESGEIKIRAVFEPIDSTGTTSSSTGTTSSSTGTAGSSTGTAGSSTGTAGSSTGTTSSSTGTTSSSTGTAGSSTGTAGSSTGTAGSSTGTTSSSSWMRDPLQPSTGTTIPTTPPNQPGASGQPSTPNQPGASGQPSTPNQPGASDQPTTPNQPGASDQPSTPNQLGASDQPSTPNQLGTPSLPQTGAVVGLSVLGGTILLASGVAISSKMKKKS